MRNRASRKRPMDHIITIRPQFMRLLDHTRAEVGIFVERRYVAQRFSHEDNFLFEPSRETIVPFL